VTAERTLSIMRMKYPEVVRPDQVHALEDQLAAAKKQREAEIVAARAAKENERMVADRERQLKPLQKGLKDAEAYRDRGMQNSKSFGSANNDFQRAIRLCELVMGRAASLSKSHANDTVMVRELRNMDQQAGEMRTDMLLTTASLYITHGQLNAAMGNVNKVLATEPDNRQALAMRGRIEVAANSGWGW